MKKIELLAPAGDLEKLKIAVLYGADAVYLGGTNFGLRAKAKNFDYDQMKEGVEFAHAHDVKVYVTCNIFAHNEDFEEMADYFKELEELNVDAILVADPGVLPLPEKLFLICQFILVHRQIILIICLLFSGKILEQLELLWLENFLSRKLKNSTIKLGIQKLKLSFTVQCVSATVADAF